MGGCLGRAWPEALAHSARQPLCTPPGGTRIAIAATALQCLHFLLLCENMRMLVMRAALGRMQVAFGPSAFQQTLLGRQASLGGWKECLAQIGHRRHAKRNEWGRGRSMGSETQTARGRSKWETRDGEHSLRGELSPAIARMGKAAGQGGPRRGQCGGSNSIGIAYVAEGGTRHETCFSSMAWAASMGHGLPAWASGAASEANVGWQ